MPAPDHPWYGPKGKGSRQTYFAKSESHRTHRTISDELCDVSLAALTLNTADRQVREDDDVVRSTRDPSTVQLFGGGAMRAPVRYD